MKYYLFTDDEYFNYEIKAKTFLGALRYAKDIFQIKGRLRINTYIGNMREYRLVNSKYSFCLREIN